MQSKLIIRNYNTGWSFDFENRINNTENEDDSRLFESLEEEYYDTKKSVLPKRLQLLKEAYLKVKPSINIGRALAYTEIAKNILDFRGMCFGPKDLGEHVKLPPCLYKNTNL